MSALLVALIVSLSLAVLPHHTTNEYEHNGVAGAATEVINGVTYEVVYLDGNHAANVAKIQDCNQNKNGNYRYVLTADWDSSVSAQWINLYGNSVIVDLRGYRVHYNYASGIYFVFNATTAELTDTSANQAGVVSLVELNGGNKTTIISGGKCETLTFQWVTSKLVLQGGNLGTIRDNNGHPSAITTAPWVKATYDADGNFVSATTPDDVYYAVSTTDLVPGAYNYVYGLVWELNAIQINKFAVPTDKTYYLWGRDADGAYEYLNCRYVDGAWV